MTVFTSSKGTQEKWLKEDYFYKRDFFGGEAEAEFLVSEFLKSCGIEDYVPYEKVGSDLCRSQNLYQKVEASLRCFVCCNKGDIRNQISNK